MLFDRPIPPQIAATVLVFAGGCLGTLGRYGVSVLLPVTGGWPLATLTVNLTGAFLLAYLLERLTGSGPEPAERRRIRLLVGSGVLGGYTTYSTLAVETVELIDAGSLATAGGYVLVTMAGGLTAAIAGFAVATRSRSHTARAVIPEREDRD